MQLVKHINTTDVLFKHEQGFTTTNSLDIAEVFEKEHAKVNRTIKNLPDFEERISTAKIVPISYKDNQGRKQTMMELDKETTTLLILSFTGNKAFEFKKLYVQAFDEMEQKLKEQQVKQIKEACDLQVAAAKEMYSNDQGLTSLRNIIKTNKLDISEKEAWNRLVDAGIVEDTYPRLLRRVLVDQDFGEQASNTLTILFDPQKVIPLIVDMEENLDEVYPNE
jgi:Rha family phage regulatory protein